MKKYELKSALADAEEEIKLLKAHIKDLENVIENNSILRCNKDREIQELQNRIKELETTIRVLQNI